MGSHISRRQLVFSAAAIGASSVLPAAAHAATQDSVLRGIATRELSRMGGAIKNHDMVGVADFAAASSSPRFHLVDLAAGRVKSLLVAHGRGSDPAHSGWLRRFSNDPGSAATSEGAFVTSGLYSGKHGASMRLVGLDPTNNNAEERAIVVHGAWYVGDDMLRQHGQLGRSEGCFAFSESEIAMVLDRLGPGRLIVSTRI
ncbi:MAG: hypothetical protein DI623_15465 [Sphingomonas sanxanigenens]|uniref:Twin-arginine translocation pathway signal protein n=1 Tax=Sphingomonas sanxanigenens TaxID=397260 RepID=A0A2W5A058_9SPHN|nr:MAG: hypothetical protein DI623_15465 [Sphingomonas sanxanigenens]